MKNILVALDFTPASKNAYRYARQLASQLEAKLTVTYIWSIPDPKTLSLLPDDLAAAHAVNHQKSYQSRLRAFCDGYPHEEVSNVRQYSEPNYVVREATDIVEGILTVAAEQEADMILIGCRAKHSIRDYLLGSISTHLIEKSELCVYIIPEGTTFEPVSNIAFATKINIGIYPVIDNLQYLAKALNAQVQQVYVETLPYDISDQHEQVMTTGWLEEAGSDFAKVTVIRESSVGEGLDYFIQKHQIQLLAMSLPQRAPIEKLFHKSHAKKMIYRSKTPLVIFRE